MNIRSLLLGSAAAFVAVSGARAADAPVTMVEPEPVEYVRVCDVYGTGFFYIPGTETCLRIGGYVRFRVNASGDIGGVDDNLNSTSRSPDLDDNDRQYDVNTQARARINVDAREETELGTLRAYARIQATNISGTPDGFDTSNNGFSAPQVYIQLGGLTVGRLDSLWAENDGVYTDTDWTVGDLSNNQIRYTFATNGFTVSGSLEDDGDGDGIPDAVIQVGYEFAFGSAFVSAVYDEDAVSTNLDYFENTDQVGPGGSIDPFFDGQDNADRDGGAFAIKAGVEVKDLISTGGSLRVEGHYAFDPTEYASLAPGGYGVGFEGDGPTGGSSFDVVSLPEEWQIAAGYQQTFGKFTGIVSGFFGRTFDIDYTNLTGIDSEESSDIWGVAGNVGYEITSNLSALGEVSFRKIDLAGGLEDVDQTRGFVQILRSF